MAAFGCSLALVTQSQAILLDGAYSLAGFGLALLALRVSTLIIRPDDQRYPFGYLSFEPILNFTKGLLIGSISLLAVIAAAISIARGGREIASGMALSYALVATACCFLFAIILGRRMKDTASPIVEVDRKNWLIDGIVSLGVAVAFLIAWLLPGWGRSSWVPYVDPSITALVCIAVLPATFRILQSNWRQMVSRSAPPEVLETVESILDQHLPKNRFGKRESRVLELGRFVVVHVYVLSESTRVTEADSIREAIWKDLGKSFGYPALDVTFTADEKWFRVASGDYSPEPDNVSVTP